MLNSTINSVNTGSINSISPSQIVSLAKGELGINTTDMDLRLERYVYMGLGALDCPSLRVKRAETVQVTCENGLIVAPIPCGFYEPMMIVPHCGDYCSQYVYADITELKRCGCNTENSNLVTWTNTYSFLENNIVLHLASEWTGYNSEGSSNTFDYPNQLDVYFWGANVDENGFVRIYQQYEAALVAYVCWKYARTRKGEYGRAEDSWFMEFKRERLTLISSERKVEAKLERFSVGTLLTALVVNPRIYSGYGFGGYGAGFGNVGGGIFW